MLALELIAPFAACRPMSAGWSRPVSRTLTPSAVYGLLLNVACIETRLREEDASHPGKTPASITKPDLPTFRIACGIPGESPSPRVQSVYQQLHNYPVGKSSGVDAEFTRGSKNNITPVRREFLSGIHLIILVDTNHDLQSRIEDGLTGRFDRERYGLPFLGDNSYLVDILRPVEDVPSSRWYGVVDPNSRRDTETVATRLTIWVDRENTTGTRSALYRLASESTPEPPEEAWTTVGPN